MIRSTQNRYRVLSAWLCLLAAALLYAPLAGAAWSSASMSCCSGSYCNIPQHHHQRSPAQPASHEDCGHDAGGVMPCSMSCCENPDKPMLTAMVFVLPAPVLTSAPALVSRAAEIAPSIEIPRFDEPLSPPPRVTSAVA